jgi:hypothetical protein
VRVSFPWVCSAPGAGEKVFAIKEEIFSSQNARDYNREHPFTQIRRGVWRFAKPG